MVPVDLFFQEWSTINNLSCVLPSALDQAVLAQIKEKFIQGSIKLNFIFDENRKQLKLRTNQSIALDTSTLHELEQQDISIKISV